MAGGLVTILLYPIMMSRQQFNGIITDPKVYTTHSNPRWQMGMIQLVDKYREKPLGSFTPQACNEKPPWSWKVME